MQSSVEARAIRPSLMPVRAQQQPSSSFCQLSSVECFLRTPKPLNPTSSTQCSIGARDVCPFNTHPATANGSCNQQCFAAPAATSAYLENCSEPGHPCGPNPKRSVQRGGMCHQPLQRHSQASHCLSLDFSIRVPLSLKPRARISALRRVPPAPSTRARPQQPLPCYPYLSALSHRTAVYRPLRLNPPEPSPERSAAWRRVPSAPSTRARPRPSGLCRSTSRCGRSRTSGCTSRRTTPAQKAPSMWGCENLSRGHVGKKTLLVRHRWLARQGRMWGWR